MSDNQEKPHVIELRDAFKCGTEDQDKVMPPEETVRRFKEKLATLDLDILAGTERIDNGRLDIPVYFSRCGADALMITGNKKQMGKGATPRQAEASAVMELAERFSLYTFYRNTSQFRYAPAKDLKEAYIPFELIAASVNDESPDLEAARRIFTALPQRWTQGFNLTTGQEMLVPMDWFFTINEFNGACAGNRPEEALCQGICEVVERHVSAIVAAGNRRVPAIDPATITDPLAREMLAKYERAGIRLRLHDFTLDTGIPTVGALAWDPTTFPERSEIVWTAGTTPGPQKALSRALSETAQLGGDFNTGSNYVASGLPKFTDLAQAGFLLDAPTGRSLAEMPDLSHPNIRVEIERLVSTLSAKRMEVLVLNTTHPGLDVPSYYVMIPGARFRERAENASVGMFCARMIAENHPTDMAGLLLQQMDSLLPDRYYIRFYQGLTALNDERAEDAITLLRRALDLHPSAQDRPSIHSYLGLALKETGRFQEAITALAEGLQSDPDRTDILNLMGFCHFKLREHEKAIGCFERIIALNPSSAIDYANIAVNWRELGNIDKAVIFFQTALELDPSIDFARENLERLGKSS